MSHSDIVSLILRGGDMNKQDLISRVYRRVIEAMNKLDEHRCSSCYVTDDSPKAEDLAEEYTAKIVNDVFDGGKVIEKMTEFVDKYYEMDPETEDVLDNGTLVVDGMKVLIESPEARAEIYDGMDSSEISQARKENRWGTVQHAKIELEYNHRMLSFITVYDDGVKRKRSVAVNHAWIVKKDSIPRTDSIYSIREEVYIFHGVTAKVVGILRDFHQNEKNVYRVRAGVDGELMSIDEYLFCVGLGEESSNEEIGVAESSDKDEPTYDVVTSDGTIIFNGTETATVMWLNAQPRDYRAGCVVGRTNSEDLLSAGAFIDLAGNNE